MKILSVLQADPLQQFLTPLAHGQLCTAQQGSPVPALQQMGFFPKTVSQVFSTSTESGIHIFLHGARVLDYSILSAQILAVPRVRHSIFSPLECASSKGQ